ncbi:MAG: cell division protein FtsA, partial [Proteobacteria bacterium]|nr:cell division protein FtsA [Pseudomonadota bacterium]
VIAALDVGTSKVCCFIAHVDDDQGEDGGDIRIAGIGFHEARGLRAGAVVDMEAAEASILAAVHHAEQMADETIRDVTLSFSAGSPQSRSVAVEVALNGHEIDDADLRRALAQGQPPQDHANGDGGAGAGGDRRIIHTIPVGYTVDGSRGIRDPRGMFGERLGVTIHTITAQTGPLRNLTSCVSRCHLDVADCVVSAYASGLACLDDDERGLGVTLIDMGGGATSIAVFIDDDIVHADVVPVGGNHITNDIARGLSTPVSYAERMKVLYGGAQSSADDERETIDVRLIGEAEDGGANPVPRAQLIRIIRPRVEEIFEIVRARLEASGFAEKAGRRMVLTGGASQLQGLRELATQMFGKSVRLGRPRNIQGLAEATGGPAYSTCAGLLHYAQARRAAPFEQPLGAPLSAERRWGRIGQWLHEHF